MGFWPTYCHIFAGLTFWSHDPPDFVKKCGKCAVLPKKCGKCGKCAKMRKKCGAHFPPVNHIFFIQFQHPILKIKLGQRGDAGFRRLNLILDGHNTKMPARGKVDHPHLFDSLEGCRVWRERECVCLWP
jgi:hypothetical protein